MDIILIFVPMSARLSFVDMRISRIPSNPALFAGCIEGVRVYQQGPHPSIRPAGKRGTTRDAKD